MAVCTTTVTPARADNATEVLVTGIVAIIVTDVVFATYGITVAAKGELPANGWAVAETIFTVPQTALGLFFTAETSSFAPDLKLASFAR